MEGYVHIVFFSVLLEIFGIANLKRKITYVRIFVCIPIKVVDRGAFQESALVKALLEDPAKFPGCSGTRTLQENISDLKAQIAANNKGIRLVSDLIEEYGLDVVQAYMKYIQENAEVAVREMLKKCAQNRQRKNRFVSYHIYSKYTT